MDLIFAPALGERINIPISDCSDEQDSIAVRFTATLGYQEYRQLSDGALKLQLWSDVASPEPDEWTAYDFAEENNVPDKIGGNDQERAMHLAGNQVASKEPPSTIKRRFVAWVPISVRHARNFSFTYRLRYSSGQIRWLGAYGHNGYAIVTHDGLRGLSLEQHWAQPGRVLSLDSPRNPVRIAGLDVTEYTMWAFPRDLSSSSNADAELLVAIPRDFEIYTSKPSYVIQSSSEATLHVDVVGSILAIGSGNITIHTCYDLSRLQQLLSFHPLSSGAQMELRIVNDQTNVKCLMILSRRTKIQAPVKIALVPLGPGRAEATVSIGVDLLAEMLGETTLTQLAVYSPTTSDVRLFRAPFTQSIPFVVPMHGGEFVLTQAHDLEDSGKEPECKVTFLVPYQEVSRAVEGQDTLPTPPPSPQFQLRRPQVTFAVGNVIIPDIPRTNDNQQGSSSELRRRGGNARSSATSNPDHQSTVSTRNQHGVLFSWIWFWIRYATILFRVFGIRFNFDKLISEHNGSNQAKPLPSSTDADRTSKQDETSGNGLATPQVQDQSEDPLPPLAEDESKANSMDRDNVIAAPRPKFGTVAPTSSSFSALYAQLTSPSLSPFQPAAEKETTAVIILSVRHSSTVTTPSDALAKEGLVVPISSLHKVLTVDGNMPEDLKVTMLQPYREDEHRDIGEWVHYLIEFSLSYGGKAMGEESRLKIAQTA